ncbi:MAG: nucleotidyltransferase family protein [Gemmatimonadota bacterium]
MTTQRRAVILAGGLGRRLAPYTFVIPKPIVPVDTMPILEIVVRQLAAHGFTRVTIALGHMSEIVRAVAGDGAKFGVVIDYSDEPKPLGTMGPLARILDLPEDFLVMNADVLTDLDYGKLWNFHQAHGGLATVATYTKLTKLELGVLETDGEHRIVGFEEKPSFRHKVSMGVYVFNKRILELIPKDTYFGFDHLMVKMLQRGDLLKSFPFDGRWLDIGVPADYERAQEEFEKDRHIYVPSTR